MKATNKFWENFTVECGASIPKKYRKEPKNHDKAKWTSQNGEIEFISKLDDMHLANIYQMLFKSEDMSKEEINIIMNGDWIAADMSPISPDDLIEAQRHLNYIQAQLHHIAYEVHKRGIFINPFKKSETMNQIPVPTFQCPLSFQCPLCQKKYFTRDQAMTCVDADIKEAMAKKRRFKKLIK